MSAHGNHGGIVGGVGEFGNVDFPNALFFHRLEGVAQSRVGAHSTGQCDVANAGGFRGFDELFHQNVDHSGFERSGEIVFVLFDELGIFGHFVFQEVEERGFQAGEAVIEAVDVRFGEAEGLGIALSCESVDDGAAGVAESHHFRALVDGFACGVVDGLSQDFEIVVRVDTYDLRITAADEQTEEGVGGIVVHFVGCVDEVGENVSVQVVDFDEGDAECGSQSLGKAHADEKAAHQTGAEGDGHGGEIALLHAGLFQCSVHDRNDVLLVGAAGQFGYHAAILFMHGLRSGDIAEEDTIAHYGSRSVVAARFDGEQDDGLILCHGDRRSRGISK